jgi:hypothetical protein
VGNWSGELDVDAISVVWRLALTSEHSKRALATSGRKTNLPSANTVRSASRACATFSRAAKISSSRDTADLYP